MAGTIDLNADMGESYGTWVKGNDAALLDVVTSANVACGFHAGDPDVMASTMALAVERGVGIGAHPGFRDVWGFGRFRMQVPHQNLANMIRYQVSAAQGMARIAGGTLRHLKLHGALANMASEDEEMARACYAAALDVQSDLTIMVLSCTAQERAARGLGCAWAGEIFADRAYNDDATLVDRSQPNAMVRDPELAAERMVAMVSESAILTESGKRIEAKIDTICCHGDTPEALQISSAVRTALEDAGFVLKPF
ncbi:MAG: 5-oxoprolinase subunit PxpA [Pseudomonadota bacterium]